MSDEQVAATSVEPAIDELVVGDPPEAWRQAGFTVDDDGICRIGTVRVRLIGRDDGKYIRGWALRGVYLNAGATDVDGLALIEGEDAEPAAPATHANGVRLIDHLVVATPDTPRTTKAFTDIGLSGRRVRLTDAETYGAAMRQTFFRLDEVILELIGPAEEAGEGPARFFGLAFTVEDLDALPDRYGTSLGRVKDAVQPGRRIATLRHRELGISVAIAFMDDSDVSASAQ